MANRYTQVNWDRPISMNVPRPFEALDAVGKQTQDRYNEGKKLPGLMQDISEKIKAAPYHQDWKQEVLGEHLDKMNQLVDQYHGDYGNPQFKMDANRLIGKLSNDPKIQTIQQESKAYDKVLEHLSDPKNARDINDWVLPKGQINTPHILSKGINSVPFADYTKHASQYTDKIIPDSNSINKITPTQDGLMYELKNGEHQFITKGRIHQIAVDNVPQYANTEGGKYRIGQFIRDYAPQLGEHISRIDYDQLKQHLNETNPQLSQHLDNYLTSDIEGLGEQKIHNQVKYNEQLHNLPGAGRKKEEEGANLTTSTQSEALQNNHIPTLTKDMEFDSKGNLKPSLRDESRNMKGTSYGSDVAGNNPQFFGNKSGIDESKTEENKSFIRGVKLEHPELKDLSDKDAIEAINKAHKSVETESAPLESISNLASKGLAEAISRNLGQRNMYLFDSEGKTEDGTKQSVLDKLGLTDKELSDQIKKNGIAGFTQAGPTPGGLYVEVKDKDDKTRRVVISQDNEIQKIFSTSHAINEARKTLTPTTVRPYEAMPDIGYQVIPQIHKDGTVTHKYYLGKFEGNKFNKLQETTLDHIRQQEKQALKESNYLGSHIEHTKDEEKDIE